MSVINGAQFGSDWITVIEPDAPSTEYRRRMEIR